MADKVERAQTDHDPKAINRHETADFQQAPGEAEAARDAFLKGAGPGPASQAVALSSSDGATRAQVISRLQRQHGNAYVQRVVAEARGRPSRVAGLSQGAIERPPLTHEPNPASRQIGFGHPAVQRDNILDLPYEELHRREALKPDPNDAYLKPPLNWDTLAMPVVVPDEPPASVRIARSYPGPPPIGMERLQWDSSNLLIPPGFYEKRVNGYRDLDAAATTLEGSWAAAAPLISAYNKAKDEINEGGALGPAPAGENWMAVPGASSYHELAEGQVLAGHTKLEDLFPAQAGAPGAPRTELAGISPTAGARIPPARRRDVSKAFEDARIEDGKVQTAIEALNTHLTETMPRAALGVKSAELAIQITQAGEEKERAEREKTELEAAKKEAAEKVDLAVKVLKTIPEAVEKPSAKLELVGIIANQIIGGVYDGKIAEAKRHLAESEFRLKRLTNEQQRVNLEAAKLAWQEQADKVPALKRAIGGALTKRRDAYHHAAELAGKAVGGGKKGERVQAAIEAIPRVQTVVGRVDAIRVQIKLPTYTEASGISFRAAQEQGRGYFDTVGFLTYLAMLKMYQSKFDGLHNEWQGRLDSLNRLAGSFNVPGT